MRAPPQLFAALLALGAVVVPAGSTVARADAPQCAGDIEDWIDRVLAKGEREAYQCLAADDAAGAALLARIDAEGFDEVRFHERVTRALAVHLMARLDDPLDPALVRGLAAPDRRLLRDSVYARRGRKSPSPAHDAVFQQFDWYEPSPTYNNGALTDRDRENIALIDDPPPPPAPEAPPSAADAMAETAAPASPPATGGCGCATGGAPAGGLLLTPLALLVVRRRTG